jgi:hypothetical protein
MAFNLEDKISDDEINSIQGEKNQEFESGFDGGISMGDDPFGGGGGGDDFSFDDIFSSGSSGGSGGGFGGGGGFGSNEFNNIFGNNNQQPAPEEPKKRDYFQEVQEAIFDSSKSIMPLMKGMVGGFKERTADDIGFYGRNLMIAGGAFVGLGVLGIIIGLISGIDPLFRISLNFLGCGAITGVFGIVGLNAAAMYIMNNPEARRTLADLPEIPDGEDCANSEYLSNIGDITENSLEEFDEEDDWMDDDEEELQEFDEDDDWADDEEEEEYEDEEEEDSSTSVNKSNGSGNKGGEEVNEIAEKLAGVQENRIITRQVLYETFTPMLQKSTPNYADVTELEPGSKRFLALETFCIKALANVANKETGEIRSSLKSAKETLFSIQLKFEFMRGQNKLDKLAEELEFYLREDKDDDEVGVSVAREGDFYDILILKGAKALISLADALMDKKLADFVKNEKNKLPLLIGVDNVGRIIYEDAKMFDSMMITGKPRSGKSWDVNKTLMQMCMWNPVEDINMIIIDPKDSNMFKTFALMPHVAGLHGKDSVLDVLEDVINNEGERRKKILSDAKVENIWDLKKKGYVLPVLYVFIDEIMTILETLGEAKRDFQGKLSVLISELPYVGIRVIFVPHRATGVIDKTTRSLIQYVASVKGANEDIKDTLGISKWTQSLINPGDMAIMHSGIKNPMYARSLVVTDSDIKNDQFTRLVASSFYKMGTSVAERGALEMAFTRDEDFIRTELGMSARKTVQYDASLGDLFDGI